MFGRKKEHQRKLEERILDETRAVEIDGKLKGKDITIVASALARPTTTYRLDLRNNKIGNDGARAIANALQTNRTLKVLDLRNNNIGGDGARAIANALQSNPANKLENLILYCNNLGNEGAKAIADALRHPNCKLKELVLERSHIDYAGFELIYDAILESATIETIYTGYSGNHDGYNTILCLIHRRLSCKRSGSPSWKEKDAELVALTLEERDKERETIREQKEIKYASEWVPAPSNKYRIQQQYGSGSKMAH